MSVVFWTTMNSYNNSGPYGIVASSLATQWQQFCPDQKISCTNQALKYTQFAVIVRCMGDVGIASSCCFSNTLGFTIK